MSTCDASPELTKLYRRVIKRVHPDNAVDEADRLCCESFTKVANDAYEKRDATALRELVNMLWAPTEGELHSRMQTIALMNALAQAFGTTPEAKAAKQAADQAEARRKEVEEAVRADAVQHATNILNRRQQRRAKEEVAFNRKMASFWVTLLGLVAVGTLGAWGYLSIAHWLAMFLVAFLFARHVVFSLTMALFGVGVTWLLVHAEWIEFDWKTWFLNVMVLLIICFLGYLFTWCLSWEGKGTSPLPRRRGGFITPEEY